MARDKKTNRRAFIRLISMGGAGLYLTGCTKPSEQKVESEKAAKSERSATSSTAKNNPQSEKEPVNSKNVTYFKKGAPEYEQLRQGHNKRIDKFPAVIALCLNDAGVAEALHYAALNNWAVAIKSSGHSLEGFSCNDNGMVINLSRLNLIEWLDDNEIKIGPACSLSKLYEELLSKGRILPGGSCGGVAIGGLALGGGYGLFSRKFGLTCDSLVSLNMIDGNGKKVSSEQDPELLWACKGGGAGNFGVITEMRFKTYPAPATLTSHRFRKFHTDAQTAADIMEKWFSLTAELPETCFSVFILNGKTVFILFTNFGPEQGRAKVIVDELTAITEKASLGRPSQLSPALKVFYGIQEPVYYKNSSAGLYNNFDDIRSFIVPALEKISASPGMLFSVGTLGGQIGNAEFTANSAFAHRSRNYLSELQTYWSKPAQEPRLVKAYNEVRDLFQNHGIDTEYINYPDLGFKNWPYAYYRDNYPRLQQIKKRYDPDNLIRYEQSVQISSK